ncbi:hypothetical protein F2Q69_00043428 [Brassica cretica]|uniref:Uncharacterized protein n=1 Tax=Brassica cretica TaxID=69181 RepID=A0A8S9NCA1_BRACR|nr:hypothetical protein F2Q69_00043428 [Brassica cretica]
MPERWKHQVTRIQAAAGGWGVQYVKFESVKNGQTEEAPLRRVNGRTIAAGCWLLGWAEGATYFSRVFAFLSLIKIIDNFALNRNNTYGHSAQEHYNLISEACCFIGVRELVALDWMWSWGSLRHTVYNSSKDETFSKLEPKIDRGGGVVSAGDSGTNNGNVVMWISPSRRLW